MAVPRVIYVMGIDGSGKTTVVESLARTLRENGYVVDVQWLRFNHLLSKPLLGFCRLVGLTRYETRGGIRVGYHEFHRSKIVSRLFILFQYLDAWRVRMFKIGPRLKQEGRVLILDRFVYDILIDLMVDTGLHDLDKSWMGRALIGLLPEGTSVVPLVRDRDLLLEARPESFVDRNFQRRLQLYEALVARQSLDVVNNDAGLDELMTRVSARVGLQS